MYDCCINDCIVVEHESIVEFVIEYESCLKLWKDCKFAGKKLKEFEFLRVNFMFLASGVLVKKGTLGFRPQFFIFC